ncbi:MAG: tyrosine-type recombinase/integrase, partial [Planctomycetota bacterium]
MHPAMKEYLDHLRAQGKDETARGYSTALNHFAAWLKSTGLDPLACTLGDLHKFQAWLTKEYRSADGAPLQTSTLATRLATLKDFYRWCARRGKIVLDPARRLKLPKVVRGLTKKDFLELQEATALLQTQAAQAQTYPVGC